MSKLLFYYWEAGEKMKFFARRVLAGLGFVFTAVSLSILIYAAQVADAAVIDKGEFIRWHYRLGFDERFRVEEKRNFDFNKAVKDSGNLFFNRFRFNLMASLADEYLNKWVEIFVDGLDAQTGAYRLKATASQTDEFDFHQAYVHLISLAYDLASGDKKTGDNVNNTFIPLYQSTHDPYGIMDFFRWENISNLELSVTFYPMEKFRFTS